MSAHSSSSPERWWLHPLAIASFLTLGLVALTLYGSVESAVFSKPSTLKYLVTLIGACSIFVLLSQRRAPLIIASAFVVVAPFDFYTEIGPVSVSPLTVLLIAGSLTVHWRDSVTGYRPRPLLAGAALIVGICLSVPIVESGTPHVYLELIGTGILTAYLVSQIAGDAGSRRTMLLVFVASATIQSGLAVWEFATGNHLNLYGSSGGSSFGPDYFFSFENIDRPSAAMTDPISLGNFLALACPMLICSVYLVRSLLARLALAASFVVILIALVATLSRMSWIAAAVGSVLTILLLPGRTRLTAALGLIGVLFVSLSLAIGIGGSALAARFSSITDPTSTQVQTASGDIIRLQLQHTALHVASDHKLSGVGFGNLTPYLLAAVPGIGAGTHAHNTYYNVLAEAGALGAIAILAVFIAGAGDAWRARRREPLVVAGCVGACVAMLFVFTTDYTIRNIETMATMAFVFGILASLSAAQTSHPRPVRDYRSAEIRGRTLDMSFR
jgi:O-antigen ligase